MIYDQAKMIVKNAAAYRNAEQIRQAAVHILGTLDASEEDLLDATAALGLIDDRKRTAILPDDPNAHPFSGRRSDY